MKGVSFLRNCGATSVEEYNRVIYCYQLSWKRKLAIVKRKPFVRAINEGLMLETSAFKLFTVASLRFKLSW